MKTLNFKEMEKVQGGGSAECGVALAFSTGAGAIFGGIGALVGAAAAATGPSCLAWW